MSKLYKFDSLPKEMDRKTINIQSIKLGNHQIEKENKERVKLVQERQLIIDAANKEAQTIINRAKDESTSIMDQILNDKENWEQEKRMLIEQAYEEGVQLGKEDGRLQGKAEYHELIDQAKEIIEQSKVAFDDHVKSSETVILQLGITVAEKILHTSLSENKEQFLPIVKSALEEVKEAKEIYIFVHPVQYELLINEKKDLEAMFPTNIQFFIYPDANLNEYDCVIESENGRIDASVSSQLVELKEKLVELLGGEER